MPCDVWSDHEWSEGRVADHGHHPVMGPFRRIVRTCRKCGKEHAETIWAREAPVRRDLRVEGQ